MDLKSRETNKELIQILNQYFEDLKYLEITQLFSGSINETYKVKIKKNLYILQKLSPIFKKEVIEDMEITTNFLALNNIQAPQLLETKTSQKYIVENNQIYRLYKYIDGETPDKLSLSNNKLKSLGNYLADLHLNLKKLNYTPKNIIPNFHNTDFYITEIQKIKSQLDQIDQENITQMIEIYNKIDKQFLEEKQVIHGDPRIENILYDERTNYFTIIDFDTIMLESIFVDIGDLCRSLFISEDLDQVKYDKILHSKFIAGYHRVLNLSKAQEDKIKLKEFQKNAIDSTIIITLELSIRFFIDYIEDKYFGFNKEKYQTRKEHNLIRARTCYELFRILNKSN